MKINPKSEYTIAHGPYDAGLLRPDPPLGKSAGARTVAADDTNVSFFEYLLAKEEAEAAANADKEIE